MFANQDFDVIDEVNIGTGTQLRLVKTHRGNLRIESWSNMSKQWNVMYRYSVEEAWASWKRLASTIKSKPKPAAKKTTKKTTAKTKATPAKAKTTRKPRKKKDD